MRVSRGDHNLLQPLCWNTHNLSLSLSLSLSLCPYLPLMSVYWEGLLGEDTHTHTHPSLQIWAQFNNEFYSVIYEFFKIIQIKYNLHEISKCSLRLLKHIFICYFILIIYQNLHMLHILLNCKFVSSLNYHRCSLEIGSPSFYNALKQV